MDYRKATPGKIFTLCLPKESSARIHNVLAKLDKEGVLEDEGEIDLHDILGLYWLTHNLPSRHKSEEDTAILEAFKSTLETILPGEHIDITKNGLKRTILAGLLDIVPLIYLSCLTDGTLQRLRRAIPDEDTDEDTD